MDEQFHIFRLSGGMIFCIAFAAVIIFHRRLIYKLWAKVAAIIICIAAVGWGALGLTLLHGSISSEGHFFPRFWIQQLLGGICVLLILTILIARPYQKSQR